MVQNAKNRCSLTTATALVAFLAIGCSQYSDISPVAYKYSKALYSVCNRQDASRLSKLAEKIEAARTASQLTDEEFAWLSGIVASAQAGEWQVATRAARQLMEAQVEGR